jgi:hypothetical protein
LLHFQKKPGIIDRAVIRLLFAIFLSVSIVAFLGGLVLGVKTIFFIATASKARGQVIAHSDERNRSKNSLPYPVFVYTNETGSAHTITQSTASVFHKFPVGSAVTILYSPKEPRKAAIGNLSLQFFGPIFLVICGLVGMSFIVFWRFLFRKIAGV